MTEDNEVHTEPLTPTDARLDALQAQMESMKAQYDAQLKSYQDANRQLFSMLNRPTETVTETVSEEPAQAQAGFDLDKCAEAFYKRIDRKLE